MNIHTTDQRNESGKTISAKVIYNSATKNYNVLVELRSTRKNANRWMGDNFKNANSAIRYAEIITANWNL